MTILFMLIIIIFLFLTIIYNIKYYPEGNEDFFDKNETEFLKGFWSIIIVLVHVPYLFQNKIQDMIGSFAYIGVTFFFMISSYGLKYSEKIKKDYLKNFWKNRLIKLLVPMFLINIIKTILFFNKEKTFISVLISLLTISKWVLSLLLYYLIFFILTIMSNKFLFSKKLRDIFCCLSIIIISLINFYLKKNWPTESLGFVYGIIMSENKEKIKKILNKKWLNYFLCFLISSLLLGVLYLKLKNIYFIGDYIIKIALGLSIISLIINLIVRYRIGNKVLKFLGKNSYEIYLIHGLSFVILDMIGKIKNSGLYIFLALVITITLSEIINKISSRIIKLKIGNLNIT